MRSRLIRVFRWQGLDEAEALADETLGRAATRLAEGAALTTSDPYRYVAGIARFVAKEAFRRRTRERSLLHAEAWPPPAEAPDARLACLERCLDRLPEGSRDLVLEYYDGQGRLLMARREGLAQRLGLVVNALRVRVHRLRASLQECTQRCLEATEAGGGEGL
jgi:DNA-directed RNA polymerase specialized sigma24 family protein